MRLSVLLGERQKEKPADAFLDSHIFMLRGGYIRQVAGGIYSLLPPAKRAVRKIENIIREEMDAIGGQEVLFPVVLPAELWQESGRYEDVGEELMRFKDRAGRPMVLGMTHEEASVHLARNEAKSYLRYPFMIYQIQTKFRDEPRVRGGLIRVREFTMKDGYSFHTSWDDLREYYKQVYAAYERIFSRVGLKNVFAVQSDSGMMGGKTAHEFMFPSAGGEDELVICKSCGYRSNMEVAASVLPDIETDEEKNAAEAPLESVSTPGIKDIDTLSAHLGVRPYKCVKAAVFAKEDGTPVIAFIRGDLSVNETKLSRLAKSEIEPFAGEADGLCLGFVGPLGLDVKGAEVWFDNSLKGAKNMVCGANRPDTHMTGLSFARDLNVPDERFAAFAEVSEGDLCSECGAPLTITKGIE
ncbi:MAG: proline--tRNA ligase, partial [Defluviitaleaceae bacterium]|nr:proline--tRNA ligase [Defluviitaleaceae bacterium]